ncbi:3-hydroxyacyl-CoA dehydrogenase NAD-binding domain-containing protein, partial [Streptomyces lushanensis]|uniref:3-hydroxyacyl-CoA dehydrogenase NAD-binding domain-containing protein n=1 Tax=Streptomyces lushanensis TaxID=1434255 RepID=UPI001FDEDD7D
MERLSVKRELFAALEDIVGDDCLLATNTSSLSVTAVAGALRLPGRLVGLHCPLVPTDRSVTLTLSVSSCPRPASPVRFLS